MRSIILYLLAASLFSCGAAKRTKVNNTNTPEISSPTIDYKIPDRTFNIIEHAKEFEGVRYKYGGASKKGMDCSGLIMTAFQKENILLPRSTRELSVYGDWIDLKQIKPGDLMFFATRKNSRKVNHVGLVTDARPGYVRFIHSTTSRGVITSTLDEKYWYFAFVQARRVL